MDKSRGTGYGKVGELNSNRQCARKTDGLRVSKMLFIFLPPYLLGMYSNNLSSAGNGNHELHSSDPEQS
ncbi:hypothetical protein CEXT_363641 [Caerostris extrusa]|uniref:Uncharacterized protein n=1 Tax=Caerostris extrusa TaxID=172846 RepID=A0AAV4XH07_CAEEX|nr:hypothetical protein CEXT_363641 [Caerostris extrusa]